MTRHIVQKMINDMKEYFPLTKDFNLVTKWFPEINRSYEGCCLSQVYEQYKFVQQHHKDMLKLAKNLEEDYNGK